MSWDIDFRRFAVLIIFLVISVNMVSAVEYFQLKSILGNNTIRNHVFVMRTDDVLYDSFIKDNRPYEVAVQYRSYIDDWNKVNLNYTVKYCNFTIRFLPASLISAGVNDSTYIIHQKNLTENYENAQYFLRLNKGDGFMADMDCKFDKNDVAILEIPADISVMTPTTSCKSCQYFEWTQQEVSISKADDIGLKKVAIVEYIKKLFLINYSNILALFWIFLIIILMLSFGFIFIAIYGVYLYIDSLIRK